MDSKSQGQQAVGRIIQIRSFFPKTQNLNAKKQYVDEFKASILKLVAYLKTQKNLKVVNELKAKLPQLENQLRNMKTEVVALQQKQQKQINKKKQVQSSSKKQVIGKEQFMSQLQKGVCDAIVKQKPNIMWDDVAGLDQAKKVLQEAVILPIKFPEVFIGQRTPWRGILLYGPPGTGKTFLAKACATQMKGGTFFSISASDLMSKYVGQSEKTLKALFQMARKERPSIIFIDEIDSIAGQRSSEQNQVSRRVKTQFLIQMQGVGNQCKDVLVLGATNLPWALDSAVRRRFQKRVYIPLPDIKGRLAMIKKVVEKNKIKMNNQQMTELANLTDGYSGSDIANMANDALMTPVRILDKTRIWMQVNDQGKLKYAPYSQDLPKDPSCNYFKGTMQELKSKGFTIYLQTKASDFLLALKSSKPSVSPNDLQKYIQFTKTFGMDG